MEKKDHKHKSEKDFQRLLQERSRELEELRSQLDDANETIEAIRTGQIDALVVQGESGHQLYTLRSADQSYRKFIEKMTEGAVSLNQQGVIVYSNTQFASIVNMPLSNVIGVPFSQFVANENKAQYEELFKTCWTADCKGEAYLISGDLKTPVQLSLTTLELDEGLSISIIITDLSFQKHIQEQLLIYNKQLEEINRQLESSNHDLQQFASIASHDLQEPLRKIQIFSDLLKNNETELSEESRKNLDKIISSAARMRNLIIDILSYSSLNVSDTPIESVDLNDIIKDVKEDLELIIQRKGAKLEAGELPRVEAYRGQVRQVFQNIVSNSLKFSDAGRNPEIRIHSKLIATKSFNSQESLDGPYCLICIKDNGIGFDENYVPNIFALFERLNPKDKYEGTGIGMAIAKKIIEKHNGLITAIGKEGSGAEFKIILPLKQSQF